MLLLHCLTFEKMHNVPAGHHTNVLGINLLVINTSNRRWRLLAQRASHPFIMPLHHVYICTNRSMKYTEISLLSFVSHLCLSNIFVNYYSKHVISTFALHRTWIQWQEQREFARRLRDVSCTTTTHIVAMFVLDRWRSKQFLLLASPSAVSGSS